MVIGLSTMLREQTKRAGERKRRMQTRLSLRYAGPAVDAGSMDVYDAAANMIAFSEFVVAASKAAYGDNVEAKAEVAGFGKGSFVTDVVVNLGGPLASLFTTGTPQDLFAVVRESINLWKHLDGQPPRTVEKGDGHTMSVTNNNGQVVNVQAQTLNVVFGEKGPDSVQRFIRDALGKEGIDKVSVGGDSEHEKAPLFEVSRSEARRFVSVAPESPLFDTTNETALIIEAPVFKEGNKWRFSDGSSSIYADITDEDFLRRVDEGEPFAKGDILIVLLRTQQRRQGEKLITDKTVVEVRDHRRRGIQDNLF